MKNRRKNVTYTKHKLTDPQLKRLSQLVNCAPAHGHGVALDALVRKGLACRSVNPDHKYPKTHNATVDGVAALNEARRAGW
jgi:hypothetical protein